MKKNKILFTLLVIICLTTLSKANNVGLKLDYAFKVKSITCLQEKSYTAYVQQGNNWIKGVVYISNGYVTRMVFPRGSYSIQVMPTALNPNNPIAVQNNFTHYVDVPNTGRAYFILN